MSAKRVVRRRLRVRTKGESEPELTATSPIPDRLYFRMGEVAALVGVQGHVLRYWESELPFIRPTRSSANQRRYRPKDIALLREVHRLTTDERLTLEGVRRRLASAESRAAEVVAAVPEAIPAPEASSPRLERVRAALLDLIRLAGEEP